MDKKTLRKYYFDKRQALSLEQIKERSKIISKTILNFLEIRNKDNISLYISINSEVETKSIINSLSKKGKNIFIAKCFIGTDNYFLSQFTNWNNLEEGPRKILQPKASKIINPNLIDVAILPGLAFSKRGVRLGYGKGVFDKLFSKSNAIKIGLAYDFQIVDKLPKEKHDLVMDLVITENRILRIDST